MSNLSILNEIFQKVQNLILKLVFNIIFFIIILFKFSILLTSLIFSILRLKI